MPSPISNRNTSLRLDYKAGLAPVVSQKQYGELIKAYEETGKLPHRLEIAGMVIDDSMNLNHWMVPKEDMGLVAERLKGQQIRKDHSDSVDSVIGKVTESWEEDGKVWAKGEIADEDIIRKILLGYIRFSSIQLLAEEVLCANCYNTNHKSEVESKITDINMPCPVCGQAELVVRKPEAIEWSVVALPAYSNASFDAIGFKAALDRSLITRFVKASKRELSEDEKMAGVIGAMAVLTAVVIKMSEERFKAIAEEYKPPFKQRNKVGQDPDEMNEKEGPDEDDEEMGKKEEDDGTVYLKPNIGKEEEIAKMEAELKNAQQILKELGVPVKVKS